MTLLDTPNDAATNVATTDSTNTSLRDTGDTPTPAATSGAARPDALAPGALAFVGAWGVGVAIARLTGAAAVVLLLVATLVALLGAALAGWWCLRRVTIHRLTTGGSTTVGDEVTLVVHHLDPTQASSPVEIEVLGTTSLLDADGTTAIIITPADAGIVDRLGVTIRTAGAPGLMFWRRRVHIIIDPLHVAPMADGTPLPTEQCAADEPGDSTGGNGPRLGDLDGTRPWRAGEGQQSIHWASTMRSGEVIAHERTTSTETRWVLPLTADAAQLRRTMEDGLRYGYDVVVEVDPDSARTEPIRHRDDVLVWSAVAAEHQRPPRPERSRLAAWKRQISWPASRDTSTVLSTQSRLLTALAALVALNMLSGALDASIASRAAVTIGIAVAVGFSLWAATHERTAWLRMITTVIAIAALARIAVQASGIGGLLEALRGPMPDLMLLLVALHGVEVIDRRTNRVHLAITAVVAAYATGLRIDGNVGWWLLAWGVVTITALTAPEVHARGRRFNARPIAGWSAVGLAGTIGLAAFVPIPDGPASLGLPSLTPSDATVDESGALLGPDGSPAANTPDEGASDDSSSDDAPERGALGQAGGYPGFSDTLDTAVRGDLGDEVVMRVRAPEPAFWRGQIFTEFDGRTWRVTPEQGDFVEGPQIDVPPTIGDLPARGVASDEFVQTFTVEADLPNVIFGAGRPETVIFDGSVVTRSDGALRADRTLVDGTVYSVVSQRVEVTPDVLRAQGDLGERFAPFADEADLQPFLNIPESTSQATLELATDLRVAGSTYDTIIAYQDWMALNTEYDLNAPVPDGDAVDDFLFHSQRGFCEQIASSLVVMLRSQGVPARLATGYIPGVRDRISGVFEVKASDAHAWVEVWFPETGWEAFDPTAEVPLSGDTDRSTVGEDAASAIFDGALSRPLEVAGAMMLVGGSVGALRGLSELRRRRRRGSWGLLHDRFMALAPDAVTAPAAAEQMLNVLGPDEFGPHEVAEELDRIAFDPGHTPSRDDRRRVAANIKSLERDLR